MIIDLIFKNTLYHIKYTLNKLKYKVVLNTEHFHHYVKSCLLVQLLPGVKVAIANPETKGQCADSHLGEVGQFISGLHSSLCIV